MRPGKLLRHLKAMHKEYLKKPLSFFQRKADELKRQSISFTKHAKCNDKLLKASFEIALLIAKTKKPHTVGEELVLPAAIKICETVHSSTIAEPLRQIPVSNDTIKNRIDCIGNNIKNQLLLRIKQGNTFAIQLDESTDNTNKANLMIFVRYQYDLQLHEDLLFCTDLPGTTKGLDIFITVNKFFSENNLDWKKCIAVCTDGAAAMVGNISGFIAEVRKVCPNTRHIHCILHREQLVFRKMGNELNEVFTEVATIVNFIKRQATSSRLFRILCTEMGSKYETLLYHSEIRWLSQGKVLQRIVELKDELRIYLIDKNHKLADRFCDYSWICTLSYLADFFGKVNDLTMSLQGKSTNILLLNTKLQAFQEKLSVWLQCFTQGSTTMFIYLNQFIEENNFPLSMKLQKIIANHLTELISFFKKYYPILNQDNEHDWIRTPFSNNLQFGHLTWKLQEDLIDIRSDSTLETEMSAMQISEFWIKRQTDYPILANMALHMLIPFATTYLCESAFSSLLFIKNKYRSCLSTESVENNLRIVISDISPDIDLLCNNIQAHPSH